MSADLGYRADAEVRIRVIYLSPDGTDHQAVITTSQVMGSLVGDSHLIRAGVDAYFAVLGGFTVLSVQLETLVEERFEAEVGQVLSFPARPRMRSAEPESLG